MPSLPTQQTRASIVQELRTHRTLLGGMVSSMWALEIADTFLGGALDRFGVHPRETAGLIGLLTMPFLHGGFAHLVANTGLLLIFGWLILLHSVRDFVVTTLMAMLVGGLGVWLIGAPGSVHVGASGVVFGYFAFLLLRGWYRRSIGSMALSLAVAVGYGYLLFGVLPGQAGISWEGHLFGFLGGALSAQMLAKPKRREETLATA
jgi:membrane associated rhomboid family serine protease